MVFHFDPHPSMNHWRMGLSMDYLWIIYGLSHGRSIWMENGIIYGIISFIYGIICGLSMDYLWTVEKNGFVLKKTCFQILWISVLGSFLIHRPYGIEDLPSLGVISWSMVYQYPKISQDIPSYLAFVFRTSSGIILQYQCGKVNEKSNLRLGMVITICESAA